MPRVLREYRLLAILVGGSAVVALSAIPAGEAPRGVTLIGVLIGFIYYFIASRRERQRERLSAVPFPDPWREVLQRRVPLYALLSKSEQERFESEIQVFLGEQRIYPLQADGEQSDAPLSDESRLLIAASAATLLLGRPEWRLPTVRDIVVYPRAFTEETYQLSSAADPHAHPQAIGMVHAQGPILLSLEALEHSFPRHLSPSAGTSTQIGLSEPVLPHVGLHEFAHVLDFLGSPTNSGAERITATGVPGMLSSETAQSWHRQLAVERQRLLAGQSVLNPYGLKSEAELFAVSVESFFQDALRMRVYHPDLYALLSEFFNQDPAARLVAHHAAFVFRPWFALGPTTRYTA
jgi:Mlc titration factor MtfA (ptsG expression regulator)